MSRKIILSLCVAIVATALGVSLVSSSSGSTSPSPAQQLARAVPAFAKAKTATDTLPTNAATELTLGPEARFAVDPQQSRLVGHAGGHRLFVATGSDNVCAVRVADDLRDRQIFCSAVDDAAEQSSMVAGPDGAGYRVFGTSPATASGLSLALEDGSSVPVTVSDGGFDVSTAVRPERLNYTAGGQAASVQVFLPPGS